MIREMVSQPSTTISTGENEIDEFYKNVSYDYMKQGLCVTYEYSFNNKPIGFVTASMSKLFTELDKIKTNFPSLLLGQLGVDQNHQGKDIGTELVKYVLGLALKIRKEVGCRLVILEVQYKKNDATGEMEPNERLVNWYKSLGFEVSEIQNKKNITFLYYDLV